MKEKMKYFRTRNIRGIFSEKEKEMRNLLNRE